jgi:hypothetical protein
MNDLPMNYEMLRSIAVQVSQELYREAQAASVPSGPSYRDAIAWVRARLAAVRQRLPSDCENLSYSSEIQHIQL